MMRVIEVKAGQWVCPFKYSATVPDGEARTACGYKRERFHQFKDIFCHEVPTGRVELADIDCPLQDGVITVQLVFPPAKRKEKK